MTIIFINDLFQMEFVVFFYVFFCCCLCTILMFSCCHWNWPPCGCVNKLMIKKRI